MANTHVHSIPRLAEKACLNVLAMSLAAAGADELSKEVASYINPNPPEFMELQLSSEPHGFDAGPIVARLVLAGVPRGQLQEVGVNSLEDAKRYIRAKIALLGAGVSWVKAFSAGSPELAARCAYALGIQELVLTPTSQHNTAYVFRNEDTVEISVYTYIVLPDGRILLPPIKDNQTPTNICTSAKRRHE
jgi:hypothetical protein